MAVSLGDDRETSAGPLDIAKNAGGDNVGLLKHDGDTSDTDILDPDAPEDPLMNDEDAIAREKNPLGYSVTAPTAAEINAGG